MSRESPSGFAALWAVALITGGLAALALDLPALLRLLATLAFFTGLLLLLFITISPVRARIMRWWDWRGWGGAQVIEVTPSRR